MPTDGREHEQPQHAGHRRRHRVGPDQQRLVDGRAADHAVGHHRQQQRDRQAAAPPPAPRTWPWSRTTPGRSRRSTAARSSRRPTNSVEVPNASCCRTLWYSAWPAGQKKKTRTMAICGAISAQGSHQLLKRTRFSTAKVRPSTAHAGLLFAFSKRSSCSLPRLTALSSPSLAVFLPFQICSSLLVDDGADLHEVAEADAARLVGGLADHLRHRDVGARVLLVEAALLGQLERGDA